MLCRIYVITVRYVFRISTSCMYSFIYVQAFSVQQSQQWKKCTSCTRAKCVRDVKHLYQSTYIHDCPIRSQRTCWVHECHSTFSSSRQTKSSRYYTHRQWSVPMNELKACNVQSWNESNWNWQLTNKINSFISEYYSSPCAHIALCCVNVFGIISRKIPHSAITPITAWASIRGTHWGQHFLPIPFLPPLSLPLPLYFLSPSFRKNQCP